MADWRTFPSSTSFAEYGNPGLIFYTDLKRTFHVLSLRYSLLPDCGNLGRKKNIPPPFSMNLSVQQTYSLEERLNKIYCKNYDILH